MPLEAACEIVNRVQLILDALRHRLRSHYTTAFKSVVEHQCHGSILGSAFLGVLAIIPMAGVSITTIRSVVSDAPSASL